MVEYPRSQVSSLICFRVFVTLWLALSAVFVARGQTSTLVEIPGTQWADRFNGPANHNDLRPVMALDAQGNVYITAETKSLEPAPAYGTEAINTDIVTIKYDRNGSQVWAATFNGPGRYIDAPQDIGVDAQGNVFITGYSWGGRERDGGTDYDFVTIKYNANGARQWVRHYNGTQSLRPQDMAFALDLDQSGNVYVTGGSFYNGVWDWLVMQFTTIKYDPAGNQLWVRNFDSPDRGGAMPRDIKSDAAGNAFVTGHFNHYDPESNTYGSDLVLLKYDPAGVLLKQTRYDTPGLNLDDEDRAIRLHMDAQGNAYVLGVSMPNRGFENDSRLDSVVLKFFNDGRLAWSSVYTRPGQAQEQGYGLVADTAGNVYVAGVTDTMTIESASTLTYKLDPNGRRLWERVVDFTSEDVDYAIGLVLDPRGDRIHVGVGAIMEPGGLHYDYVVLTYLANGTQAGVRSYDNPAHSDDSLRQIEIDGEGDLYLVGAMRTAPGTTSYMDLLTVKVASTSSPAASDHTISGAVTLNGTGLGGVKLTLTSTTSGFAPRTATSAAATGAYSFGDLPAGRSYVVTPSSSSYVFTPKSKSYPNLAADQTEQNFAATRTYTISGSVLQGGSGLGGVRITLTSTSSGFTPRVVTSASSTGAFTFTGVPAGRTYVITPSSNVYTFTPASRTLSSLASNQVGQNFSVASRKTYSISGRVTRAGTTSGIGGVTMSLTNGSTGAAVKTVTTLSDGRYSLTSIPAGFNYVLRPSKSGMTFTPTSRSYANLSANQPVGTRTAFSGN